VTFNQLILLIFSTAYSPPEGGRALWGRKRLTYRGRGVITRQHPSPRPPEYSENETSDNEAGDGQGDPMLCEPEDRSRIPHMPAVAHVMGEETPTASHVLVMS